jgi:hypothetical protein
MSDPLKKKRNTLRDLVKRKLGRNKDDEESTGVAEESNSAASISSPQLPSSKAMPTVTTSPPTTIKSPPSEIVVNDKGTGGKSSSSASTSPSMSTTVADRVNQTANASTNPTSQSTTTDIPSSSSISRFPSAMNDMPLNRSLDVDGLLNQLDTMRQSPVEKKQTLKKQKNQDQQKSSPTSPSGRQLRDQLRTSMMSTMDNEDIVTSTKMTDEVVDGMQNEEEREKEREREGK